MRNEHAKWNLRRIPYCLVIEDAFARFHGIKKEIPDSEREGGPFCAHGDRERTAKAKRRFNTVPTV
jgi:hypothetical protein